MRNGLTDEELGPVYDASQSLGGDPTFRDIEFAIARIGPPPLYVTTEDVLLSRSVEKYHIYNMTPERIAFLRRECKLQWVEPPWTAPIEQLDTWLSSYHRWLLR